MDRFIQKTPPTKKGASAATEKVVPQESQTKRKGRPRNATQGAAEPEAKAAKVARCQGSGEVETAKPVIEEDNDAGGDEEKAEQNFDLLLDHSSLVDIARRTWNTIEEEDRSGLGGVSPDEVLAWPALQDGRMPFQLLAAVFELGDENEARLLRALTHTFSWILSKSKNRDGDFDALLFALVSPSCPHPQIAHSIGEVFKKKIQFCSTSETLGSLTAYQSPHVKAAELQTMGLEGRRSQRTLFASRRLALAEVAHAKEPIPVDVAALPPSHGWPWVQRKLQALLGKASVERREVFHLIRVLQLQGCPSASTVLRAAAYALQRAAHGDKVDVEQLAHFDAALFRAWAERGAEPGWLAKLVISPQLPTVTAIESAAKATCGFRVRPMRAEDAANVEEALSKMKDAGPIWCERLLDGRRAQVHIHSDGSPLQVFAAPGSCTAMHPEGEPVPNWTSAVSEIVDGGLRGAGDAILEVMLMGKCGGGTMETVHCVVVFDALVLGGESLTRLPFRERRRRLEAALVVTPKLQLVPGVEIAPEADRVAIVKKELVGHCGASIIAKEADEKNSSRALGAMLKVMDAASGEYTPGVCSPHWQALTQPPATEGPEAEKILFESLSDEERSKLVEPDAFHFCVVSARRTQTKEGRDDIMLVQKQFQDAGVSPRWYVDKQSLEDYRKLGLDAIEGGKLIPARNMCLDDAQNMGKVCVQASDDIEKWMYVKEQGGWTPKKTQQQANAAGRTALRYIVSPVAAARFILAKMRGASNPKPQLGGVLPHHNPGMSLRCAETGSNVFILGDFFVVDKSACRFDTRMTLKEDYDLTAAHLKAHGSVLRCNHLMVWAKHETNAGGACSTRDSQGERERENIKILQEKYPGAFKLNPHRQDQVVLVWRGHLKWLREQEKEQGKEKE